MSTRLALKPATEKREEEVAEDIFPGSQPALERVEELAPDEEQAKIRNRFEELADELEEATGGLSSTRRAVRYPAFVEIMELGDAVIPQVVDRLLDSHNRPLWLRMLGTLTSLPPGAGQATVDEAANAWIQWQSGRLVS